MEDRGEQDQRAGSRAGSLRELLTLALPLVASSGSLSLMHVVDRVFLTWDSTESLAASLPAGLLHWTLLSIPLGCAQFVNAFVAQYEGAHRPQRVSKVVWQGAYFSLLVGLLLLLAIPLGDVVFRLLGHDDSIRQKENAYYSVLMIGSAPALLACVLSCFYSGRGQAMAVLWVNVVGSLVDGILDYALIFGAWGFPRWGIYGAAATNVIGSVVMCLMYIGLLVSQKDLDRYKFWHRREIDWALLKRLMIYGLPNGAHMFVDIIGFTLFVLLVGGVGRTELAATSLVFNLNALAFVPMLGFGTAIVTIVGQRIGEGRPALAKRTVWIAFALSTAYMSAFGGLFAFAPGVALFPFERLGDAELTGNVRDLAIVLLKFVAVFSLFDTMNIVFSSAIRGAGDTRFAMILTAVAGFGVMVAPTAVWIQWHGGGVVGAWTFVTLFVIVLGFSFLARFLGERWMTMRVIEWTDQEDSETIAEPEWTASATS